MLNGRVVLALLGSFFLCASTMAASLGIAPVGLDLPATTKAETISLANRASSSVTLQLRAYKWQQPDGEDELIETRDVVVSPPSVSIPPGQTYTVRVVRVSTAPITVEESYRLLIDEVPVKADERAVDQGVSMVLRTSLPVFYSPKNAIPDVQWTIWREAGEVYLEGTNNGDRHVKLMDLGLQIGSDAMIFGHGLTGYILPGATRKFTFNDPNNSITSRLLIGAPVTVIGRAGAMEIKETINVSQR